MVGTRTDIAKLGGPWAPTMVWYARAVEALRARPFANRTSWTYLAAIHGIDPAGWSTQGLIGTGNPPPGGPEQRLMFNQCQHAGWFFLPWHRGYLAAFEAILFDWITENGGPDDWALPYWNYLNASLTTSRDIPVEFTDAFLPGTTDPNPLADALRGPATRLGPQTWITNDISLTRQINDKTYTAIPGTIGYGGPISGFTQSGNAYGGLESNPHNDVHVMIGGDPSPNPTGWMYDPNFAALDPIFWVHHCNVDRLWSAWMSDPTNSQELSQAWRNGPFPRQFVMPDAAQSLSVFIPDDTLPGAVLDPVYDDLIDGTGKTPPPPTGGPVLASSSGPTGGTPSGPGGSASLIGVNAGTLSVGTTPTSTSVSLTTTSAAALMSTGEERYYLNVEGVRGPHASAVVTARVFISGREDLSFEETFVFFGLANASAGDGPHAGNGLSSTADITERVQELQNQIDAADPKLEVELAQPPSEGDGDRAEITVDRISIYERI